MVAARDALIECPVYMEEALLVIFLKKVVDGRFQVPIMRTTPSDEALKELENQALTKHRSREWWSGRRFA
ncbi:hypothetical protein NK553_14125, partial [Pseudomonas sp. ZM23]|uniref:hypothetical protein n=1 Tax=Pseudomonas triclosanedens TaxID=2961893 RepID=UPI0020C2DA29